MNDLWRERVDEEIFAIDFDQILYAHAAIDAGLWTEAAGRWVATRIGRKFTFVQQLDKLACRGTTEISLVARLQLERRRQIPQLNAAIWVTCE